MKYKVGDKVRMISDVANAKEGYDGIIKAVHDGYYSVEFPCFDSLDGHDCNGEVKSNKGHFISEINITLLGQSLTFQQKLDRFKSEPIGFLVKSKEIADELAKVFTKERMEKNKGDIRECLKEALIEADMYPGYAYVIYNASQEMTLTHGTSDFMGELNKSRELLDVTLDELKSYNASTLEDKLELFKAGTHVLHTPTQETYDKLMVELEKRGYALVANEPLEVAKGRWRIYGNETCIRYAPDGQYYGKKGVYVGRGKEIIELTPEDFKDSEQEEHMKITIETDGHYKTTAECNGITAESLCNPTDEFDLPKGVHMAVQRLLEKLEVPEEDTGFHVGDIVEVVANEAGFKGNPVGLQGIVKEIVSDGANVKLPIRKRPLYFYNRELKLIRRGNN